MILEVTTEVMEKIQAQGEAAYPEEGAGLLLGQAGGEKKQATQVLTLGNAREQGARHNRYLLTPQDYLRGELEASRLGLEVIGVFHSHPDHPDRPSEFDREWAMPWFSYMITSVQAGKAASSRSWRLAEGREGFLEEKVVLTNDEGRTTNDEGEFLSSVANRP